MTGLLQAWDKPLVSSKAPMHWMSGHDAGPMVGMARQDELNQLGELAGVPKEISLLRLMILHHEGAVVMAGFAAEHSAKAQVVALAQRMVVEQAKESRELDAFLRQRDA